MSQKRLFAFAG